MVWSVAAGWALGCSNTPNAPVLAALSPTSGSMDGGTVVTLYGSGFDPHVAVAFGGLPASSVSFVDSTKLTTFSPAQAPATVTVTVTNPDGQAAALPQSFKYLGQPPILSLLLPTSGQQNSVITWTLLGSNFGSGARVLFTDPSFNEVSSYGTSTSTSLTAIGSCGKSERLDVTLVNSDGQESALASAFWCLPNGPPPEGLVLVVPEMATVPAFGAQQFAATVAGAAQSTVTWSLFEQTNCGVLSSSGLYSAPGDAGVCHVVASNIADPTLYDVATVTVTPPLVIVTVSPSSATVQAGAAQQFTATATGTSNTDIHWYLNPVLGSVDDTGLFRAGTTLGTLQVIAYFRDGEGQGEATVTIVPNTASVSVSPATVMLTQPQTQQFTATVTGTSDTVVNWDIEESGGGSIDADGLYTTGSPGTFHVRASLASNATVFGEATVTVAPILQSITVSPSSPTILVGGTQQFTAVLTGLSNPAIIWTVDEPTGGSVSDTGFYTAPLQPGVFHVRAASQTNESIFGEATVTVPNIPVTVSVSPPSVTVGTDGTQQFTATVDGTALTGVTWSVDEANGGSVSVTGLYVPSFTPGTFHARATSVFDTSSFGEATITVVAAPITVTVSPSSAAMATNASLQFAATLTGTSDLTVVWSVDEAGGGTVSAAGLYTAPLALGTFHVRATSHADPTRFGEATVTVAPSAISVSVAPNTAHLQEGAMQQFAATVTGTTGNTSVTWSVEEGSAGGSVSSAGLYTAPSSSGEFHVQATSVADPSKFGVSTVIVQSP